MELETGYRCDCDAGYTNQYCDTFLGCEAVTCNHGDCIASDTGYTCGCIDGYEGKHCETGEILFIVILIKISCSGLNIKVPLRESKTYLQFFLPVSQIIFENVQALVLNCI